MNPLLFTEPSFLFGFAPIVLTAYYLIPGAWRAAFLLIASLLLYTWAEGANVAVLLACAMLTYGCGLSIARGHAPRSSMAAGVIGNVLILGIFKYAALAVSIAAPVLKAVGVAIAIPSWHQPAGLSFFTFIAIGYLVDVYRKDAAAELNPFRLTLFLAMFPQLVAGPITRFTEIGSQLRGLMHGGFTAASPQIATGIRRFVIGFCKKILIADTLAPTANAIFSLPAGQLSLPSAWLGVLCYTLQIYFDFSGYSDMAIGLAAMLGVRFPENFNYPYIARSVTEFWHRWHITLSTWLRDYLFFPLGVRGGRWKLYRNTIVVFLICGLWHGPAWHFVVWGLYYGVLLVIERAGWSRLLSRLPGAARHGYTLGAIMLGWVIFRAESVPAALAYLGSMFGRGSAAFRGGEQSSPPVDVMLAMIAGVAGSMPLRVPRLSISRALSVSPYSILWAAEFVVLCVLFVLSIAIVAAGTYSPFLYSRF